MKQQRKTAAAKREGAPERAAQEISKTTASVPGLLDLNASQRKRTPKIHEGGEKYIHAMANLARGEDTQRGFGETWVPEHFA